MKCPYCGYFDSKVVDSRPSEATDTVRRRRECLECERRFTTFEKIEEIPLTVVKKEGGREPFDPNKLMIGLVRATIKRPVSREVLEKLVNDIEAELRNEFKYEVSSSELGERVLRALKDIDKVAYIRFASVYREFNDLQEFTDELKRLH